MENKEIIPNDFTFTLYLNDNIIIQRDFPIESFNKQAIRSLTFKEIIDDNIDIIKRNLKFKTIGFMLENEFQFMEKPSFQQNDSNDVFKFILTHKGNRITYREIDATLYPLTVRYTVDIRSDIYNIITKIQRILSKATTNLETTFFNYNLLKNETSK